MLSTQSDQVQIRITQEPQQAYEACEQQKRNRWRRIEPPPKIEVEVDDSEELKCYLTENPRTFIIASIVGGSGVLFGKTVASLECAKDQAMFVFPDLFCTKAGRYNIRFTLFSRDSDTESAYCVGHVDSNAFEVHSKTSSRRRAERTQASRRALHEGLFQRSPLADVKKSTQRKEIIDSPMSRKAVFKRSSTSPTSASKPQTYFSKGGSQFSTSMLGTSELGIFTSDQFNPSFSFDQPLDTSNFFWNGPATHVNPQILENTSDGSFTDASFATLMSPWEDYNGDANFGHNAFCEMEDTTPTLMEMQNQMYQSMHLQGMAGSFSQSFFQA